MITLPDCTGNWFEERPPEEILAQSVERMGELAGFHYLIERSGFGTADRHRATSSLYSYPEYNLSTVVLFIDHRPVCTIVQKGGKKFPTLL